jgi:hypothetical protein
MTDDTDSTSEPEITDDLAGHESTAAAGSTASAEDTEAVTADRSTSTQDAGETVRRATGSATRRPTPAASAASRARRIGGATGTHKVLSPDADPVTATDAEPVSADTGRKGRKARQATAAAAAADPARDETVSMRKRQPRTTSARDLKSEAESGTAVVTEVPAWLRWVPAAVLSVCAVAMIVIIAVAAHGVWYAKPSTSGQRDQVLAAAKRCTALANTYNYKTLPADEKRGLACTTGAWTTQYKQALTKIVIPSATQLKASQTVQINAAGIESVAGGGTQWTTIVYGQLTINQTGAAARIDPFAAIVRLDKVKSTYLVSKIDLITSS